MTITRKTTCFGTYWPSLGFLQENWWSYYIYIVHASDGEIPTSGLCYVMYNFYIGYTVVCSGWRHDKVWLQPLVRWFYEELCSSSFLLIGIVFEYTPPTVFTHTTGMTQFKFSPDVTEISSLCWCTYVVFQTVIYIYKSSVVCSKYYFRTVFSMPNMSVVSTGVNNDSHRIQISWKYLSLERSWPSIACFKLGYFGYIKPFHTAAATQRWGTGELRLYILQKWTETMELSVSLWKPRTCMRHWQCVYIHILGSEPKEEVSFKWIT